MNPTDSPKGRLALMLAHVAGMLDMAALPVWVGTLIGPYHFNPQQAGLLVTLFLVGVVISSLFFGPRFYRIRPRTAATFGYGLAAAAFVLLSLVQTFELLLALHVLGGLAVGCGLSFTHGTIGRSRNPHRLFAIVSIALGVTAIVFLGGTPKLIEHLGGPALFWVFAAVMAIATLSSALAFPDPPARTNAQHAAGTGRPARLSANVRYAIVGITCMALTQAMIFSFVERIGIDRGFGANAVIAVLIVLGFVNLFPTALAALLQHRLAATRVAMSGPVLQALLALVITNSAVFALYAGATAVYVSIMLFTHTFVFGLLARLDVSSRAVAMTPAMIMSGSAVGPILGGSLVHLVGYAALGWAAVVIGIIAVWSFSHIEAGPASRADNERDLPVPAPERPDVNPASPQTRG